MKDILVTGADGFIGSHLTELLVKKGYKVRAFVLYNSFNSWGWLDDVDSQIINNLEIFVGDIRDPCRVREAVKGCDCVIHLASLIAIPYSYNSPDTYIDTNVKGTLNILQAVKDYEINQLIHTSTSEVYGTAEFVPITEAHPIKAQSPYAASKIAADQLAFSFYSSFDLPVTTIRPFNTYGPRQSARAVIPSIITQIASGKTNIELGSTFPTRDFSYVEDTVNGFASAIGCFESIGETINLGSNFEISILDTVKFLSRVMKRDIQIVTDNQRKRPTKSEVERLFASNEKARRILKWIPKYSGKDGFIKGLVKTVEWFTNNNNIAKYKTNRYNK